MNQPHALLTAYRQNGRDAEGSLKAGMNHTKYLRYPSECTATGFKLGFHRKYWWVIIHLKHIRLQIQDPERAGFWITVYENDDLPREDEIRISFEQAIHARYWRIEALSHHGTSGHHQEVASSGHVVDFDMLDHFELQLEMPLPDGGIAKSITESNWEEPMRFRSKTNAGGSPGGVTIRETTNEIVLSNSFMRMGLSKLRPIVTSLAWDSERSGRQSNLLNTRYQVPNEPVSGPWLSVIEGDIPADCLGGEVVASGNEIRYEQVSYPALGLTRSYRFVMLEDAVEIVIEQEASRTLKAIECEALRWIWDLRTAITATLAVPHPVGMTGRCTFPAILHAPNFGNLAVELVEGDPAIHFIKADTWRDRSISWTGFEIGVTVAEDGELLIPAGQTKVKIRLSNGELALHSKSECASEPHPAFRRAWGSIFGFRPEYFGMSNNAASLNCHFVQHSYMDLASFTRTNADVNMLELCACSVELALAGGAGYGDNREFFMDSDASLLTAAGVYVQQTRNRAWALRNWSNMKAAAERITDRLDSNLGLIKADKLTGNTGEWHWSTNWWDVIGFGHLDAFSNALAYRGLRQMQSMAGWLGFEEESRRAEQAADEIQRAYFNCFYNESSGWLGGWRSQDGKLHDYAFTFVNGIAILYGLVPEVHVRPILERLEAKRREIGFRHVHLGMPGNFIPIPKGDYVLAKHQPTREDGKDAYGTYQNGGATLNQAYFYIRALGKAGMPAAKEIENAILDAFEYGDAIGGIHEGNEWRSWDGRKNGYEGLLSDQTYVLLAIAQNQGHAEDLPLVWY